MKKNIHHMSIIMGWLNTILIILLMTLVSLYVIVSLTYGLYCVTGMFVDTIVRTIT